MHETHTNDPAFQLNVLAYANELANSTTQMYHGRMKNSEDMSYEHEGEVVERHAQPRKVPDMRQPGLQKTRELVGGTVLTDTGWKSNQLKTTTHHAGPSMAAQQSSSTGPTLMTLPPLETDQYAMSYPIEIPVASEDDISTDEFSSISQIFFDQQFLDRDRVISYHEGMFTSDVGWWG
jgi:hypothetical protein